MTVLTTDPTGTLPRYEKVDGITVHRVPAWPAHGDLYFAPGIASRIQRRSRFLVHCQGFHTLVAPIAMAAAAARHVPYVVTFHSGGHSSALRNAIRPAQTAMLAPLLRRAEKLIAVSSFESKLFQARLRLPPDRFVVVPNGADLPPSEPSSAERTREDLIVSVGRLERYKGHHRIIAALPIVAQRIPRVRLVIVGSGPYDAALRQSARQAGVADRVEIRSIPSEHRSELGALLARAGLVTLLSEYESQGISVMEALAMGAPVLTSNSSALGELGTRGLVTTVPLAASNASVAEALIQGLRTPHAGSPPSLPTWDDAAEALHKIYSQAVGIA